MMSAHVHHARFHALALAAGLCAALACTSAPPEPQQRTFAAPEDAVRTLNDVVSKAGGNVSEIAAIFGPDAQSLIDTSDPVSARRNRELFAAAVAEHWRLVDDGANRKVLVVGNEDWPFPVPLVRDNNVWRFDTAAGKEEVIARRIGRNEIAVMQICRAYVAAQRLYAESNHDDMRAGVYAQQLRSDPGRHNGLFWPSSRGEKRSPLGTLIASAADVPVRDNAGAEPSPFYGYLFRILTAQGAAAPGGARNYIVKGVMSDGFALVAWPVEYDVTGVMTFIVNQDGRIHERDLGPETAAAARSMTEYNPEEGWSVVP